MTWLEISVAADQEAAESIAELLARYGYNRGVAIEATPLPDAPLDDAGIPYPLSDHPTYPVVLRTYLPLDEEAEEKRQQIEQALWHLGQLRPIGAVQTRILAEEDWANAWKQFYAVQRIGERIVIVPSWLDHTPQPDDIILNLDPGMAFGTGLHPTTRLCLRLLEQYTHPGTACLDLGTGSGILAIAAAHLGAAPVLALDNDPVAVEVAQSNIERNAVGTTVQVALGSLGAEPGQEMGHWLVAQASATAPTTQEPAPPMTNPIAIQPPFGLILANIIADVLINLATDLAEALAPDGILLTSGIIQPREMHVALAFAAAGLHQVARHSDGDWVALVHRK